MIGNAIYYILSNNANVSAIVGTKIYPIVRPQEIEVRAIVYDIASTFANNTKDGKSEIDQFNVYLYAFADTYEGCQTLMSLIRTALMDLNGTYNSVAITSSWVVNPETDQNIDTTEIFSMSLQMAFRVKK
jgi:hypothetical protein